MNIRKKIISNPSYVKSHKPGSSENITANTKSPSVLQVSKTFRFSNNKAISTKRQMNCLRSIIKDQNEREGEACISNKSSNAIKRRNFLDSSNIVGNENCLPVIKSTNARKFTADDHLPPLVPIKRKQIYTSNMKRNLANHPSSLHFNRKQQLDSPQQFIQKASVLPKNEIKILGVDLEQIERKKQKLNSLNIESFYRIQKGISQSKHPIISKQNKKPEQSTIQKPQRSHEFSGQKEDTKTLISGIKCEQQVEQSIVEEIQIKNQNPKVSRMSQSSRSVKSYNDWSGTLKSSFNQSTHNKMSVNKQQNQYALSSLCQSQQIDQGGLQPKTKSITNKNGCGTQPKSLNQNQTTNQKVYSVQQSLHESNSQLCQSYHINTPQIKCKQNDQSQSKSAQ